MNIFGPENRSENITLTMEGLLIGTGWHEVEREGDIYFRWIGPDNTATIHLNIFRHYENRLNMAIYRSISEEVLQSIQLEADGVPLQSALSKTRDPAYLTAIIPKDASKLPDQHTVLRIRISKTLVGKDVIPGSTDKRFLGVALQSLHIFPLSRPLFIAEKIADPVPFDGMDFLENNPGAIDSVLSGMYSSAYDYYRQKGKDEYKSELHAEFDERPGDLYDLLTAKINKEHEKTEQKLLEEIALLQDVICRQDDRIKYLEDIIDKFSKEKCNS